MSEAKRHHYIPQFILKNFLDNKGQVFYWDIEKEVLEKRNPRSIFMNFDMYRDEVNHKDKPTSIESSLAIFEGEIATLIRQKFLKDNEIIITRSELEALRIFLSLLSFRSDLRKDQYKNCKFNESTKTLLEKYAKGNFEDLWKREIEILSKCRTFKDVKESEEIDPIIKTDFMNDIIGFYMTIIESFANRLQKAMNYANMKQVDLVNKTGLDKTLINKYLAGIMKAKQDKLTILADALNVNEVWLMGYDVPMERNLNAYNVDELGNSVIPIPILGTVKAGYDYLAQENWIGTIDVETSLVGNGEDYFALKVHGDSMSPSLIENDIVIVKKQNDFENGNIVVAIINGNEATIKRGKKSETGILLQPLNTAYEPLIFTNEEIKNIPVLIVGVVKQLKREY